MHSPTILPYVAVPYPHGAVMQATNWLKTGLKGWIWSKTQGFFATKIGRQKRVNGDMPSYLLYLFKMLIWSSHQLSSSSRLLAVRLFSKIRQFLILANTITNHLKRNRHYTSATGHPNYWNYAND